MTTWRVPWWTSFSLIGVASLLWLSGRRNPDDVIGLLEKLLALVFGIVVVLVSRNYLLEAMGLLVALLLVPGDRRRRLMSPHEDDLGGLSRQLLGRFFTSRMEMRQELGKMAWAASTAWPRSTDWRISSPHSLPQ